MRLALTVDRSMESSAANAEDRRMSTTELPRPIEAVGRDEWYEWPGLLDWPGYKRLLRARGESRVPRMVYLDGSLLLMTPALPHEFLGKRLAGIIHEVAIGCVVPYLPTGSTTWRRRKKDVGVEGDLTYYLANEPAVRGKRRIDLRTDPPPDLAVEVVYSHDAARAIEVYRRLGVPEVWVATEREFSIRMLDQPGKGRRYHAADRSLAFPFLPAAEIAEWVYREAPDGETRWLLEVRAWVRDVVAPRRDAEGAGA